MDGRIMRTGYMLERTIRMNTLKPLQSLTGRRHTSVNSVLRRMALLLGLVVALCVPLLAATGVRASGAFWMPTQKASDPSFDHINPVLATYKNHAYVLSVRVNGSSNATSVYFSTNESGAWKSQLMSAKGPPNTYSRDFTSLAVDPNTGRLYAAWVYQKNANQDALGVWTRDPSGKWSAPTDAVIAGSLVGQAFIAAGNGKAYAAFISSETTGACNKAAGRNADVEVTSFSGSAWSAPQNLTSCVPGKLLQFATPKVAIDEQGRGYLVSVVNGDLWYTDNSSGSWSTPTRITRATNVPDSVGTALRTFYGIAASNGTAYVAYVRHAETPTDDVLLMSHAAGGSWSASSRVSPADPQDCPKFGVSIVANQGRVGISYARGSLGYCHASGGKDGNVPFVVTGSPGHMFAVGSLEGKSPNCFATSLAKEGNLFRFVAACDHPTSLSKGQLYYKAELLDLVGPVAQLHASRAASTSILLRWTGHDPAPGSGVAAFELQSRTGGGAWKTLLKSTTSQTLAYHATQRSARFTFRLRARDRAANWGAWVSAGISTR
jgi:hypothetical protein